MLNLEKKRFKESNKSETSHRSVILEDNVTDSLHKGIT